MNTREALLSIAAQMYESAVESHVQGMERLATSTRVKQFETLEGDESCAELLRLLVEGGLVDMVDGKPVLAGDAASSSFDIRTDGIRTTSKGGSS